MAFIPHGHPEREENLARFKPVRDEQTKPKVFYHGTQADEDFSVFSDEDAPYRGGIKAFVSESPKFASSYGGYEEGAAWMNSATSAVVGNHKGRVYPVHIHTENPFDFRKQEHVDKVYDFWGETGGIHDPYEAERLGLDENKPVSRDDFLKLIKQGEWEALESPEFVEWLRQSEGHDSVVTFEGGVLNYGLFEPTQIKSATGNQGTFDPNDPDITKAQGGEVEDANTPRTLNEMGLYSHGAESALRLPQARGTAQQFRSMLMKQGVKPGELEGFSDAFSQQPFVTREQAAQYFRQKMPQIEESVLSGNAKDEDKISEYIENAAMDSAIESDDVYSGAGWRSASPHIRQWHRDLAEQEFSRRYTSDPQFASKFEMPGGGKYAQYKLPDGENYREVLLKHPSAATFKSEHWEEPNVLLHLRLVDRMGPNGEKVLHLEELQSDWAQRGREKGFGAESGIPEAPYVTSTQGWTDLGLKRVLKEALDGGYDKIAWTPGDIQADRYPGGTPEQMERRRNGMRSFYDKIVPTQLQKLVSKLDPNATIARDSIDSVELPSLSITPKMRENIRKGFPHMAGGGEVEPEGDWELDLSDIPEERPGITGYHGSPYDFDRFDLSRAGTGEGAAAYGHGVYTAEHPDVARGYRDTLTEDHDMLIGNEPIGEYYAKLENRLSRMPADQAEQGYNQLALIEDLMHGGDLLHIRENAKQGAYDPPAVEWFEREIAPKFQRKGRLYEVHIDAHPKEFLDWDNDLNHRNNWVVGDMLPGVKHYDRAMNDHEKSPTGAEFYESLVRHAGSHEAASRLLYQAGIKGIRYLDEDSRGGGTGTKNYVVFDDKLVNVKRKYADGGVVKEASGSAEPLKQPAKRKGRASSVIVGERSPIVDRALMLVSRKA